MMDPAHVKELYRNLRTCLLRNAFPRSDFLFYISFVLSHILCKFSIIYNLMGEDNKKYKRKLECILHGVIPIIL